MHRNELVGIDREHLESAPEGVVITLPHSKTDQESAGRKVAIAYGQHLETCAVRALAAWLASAGISSGPVFRAVDRHDNIGAGRLTGKSVAVTVKNYMAAIGKDPAAYAGHSLRTGFATAVARAGAEERAILRQTGHRSTVMVRRYIRDGSLLLSNAASVVGLWSRSQLPARAAGLSATSLSFRQSPIDSVSEGDDGEAPCS